MMEDDKDKNNNLDPVTFIWCLVGNIIEERFFGEDQEIKKGTRKFSPGAKVYCFPALWGDGYEEIKVIGRTRRRKNYSVIITSTKFITNWRIQKVFTPFIIKKMTENKGWDATEESKNEILAMLNWLPSRTMKINKNE